MSKFKISIIGLGYVGLPLAVEFSKAYETIAFDIDKNRVSELKEGHDNKETYKNKRKFSNLSKLRFTYSENDLKDSNFYIITVPTPLDNYHNPDLTSLLNASTTVAKFLRKNDIVVYESTVFPGATEDVCLPILEKVSGLKLNKDFFIGYSPERINPGDDIHTIENIIKVVAGSNDKTAKTIEKIYKKIVKAGTYRVSSIRVAEAAKVIENTQRDINIAFINELSMLFNKLDIDTTEVLEAASTKWNFLNFKPGLVGGHCIGVDPYYLAQKADSIGFYPEMILSGRRINDNMGVYVANEVIKLIFKKNKKRKNLKVLVLGLTFKEDFNDMRNSRSVDIINTLKNFQIRVEAFDPFVNKHYVKKKYDIDLVDKKDLKLEKYDSIILAVGHSMFKKFNIKKLKDNGTIVYDVKSFFNKDQVTARL